MRKILLGSFLFGCLCFSTESASAQIWKKVQQKLENKVEQQIDQALDGKAETKAGDAEPTTLPNLEKTYSFLPGNTVFFRDNFENETFGRMPKKWKSSGGGSVEEAPGVPGKWLALAARTSYRLDSLLMLPENFTLEFDLFTQSVEARDIGSMSFGFARDNANRSYISDAYNDNAITSAQLHFHNKEVTNSSSDTKIYNPVKFPLNSYSNATLHVSIAVEGEHMRIYINKAKLLDTRMFKRDAIRYFYLSAPFSYNADAQVFWQLCLG
ncbi:hypothetical protein [Sphingobacterium bambusae]|uniref:Uncharacterized protein n=1 Tax=Sphingobacterium bambusae TaxID=662858 RepID=A0ABW6BIJ5_9SPHI|nr:hypothetical protein [Sphingobacterium bambusae]WPL49071.1 hypothetical protein SCB77_01155 [Sphingobacterium bambusae]